MRGILIRVREDWESSCLRAGGLVQRQTVRDVGLGSAMRTEADARQRL